MVQRRRRRSRAAGCALSILAAAAAGCDVEWGGGEISLEDPSPPPDASEMAEALEPEQLPLSPGPYLHLVRLQPDGAARLVPVAQMPAGEEGRPLVTTPMPTDDPTYRTRFDSAFLAPGSELDLLARGGRIGTLVVDGSQEGTGACPSVGSGQAILPPGQDVPDWAFAAPAGTLPGGPPRRIAAPRATRSMSVAAPVLAERLIGGERAYLARRMDLSPVELAGDTLAGMAATYLIADSLAAGPPGENAISLFFVARFEPARGFLTLWQEVRRYDAAQDKEAFRYLDWIPSERGRLDFLRRYDAATVRLAAGLRSAAGGRSIVWMEGEGCEALRSLGAG